ncbi:MAG: hypothetical protein WDN69_05785 [Aliidongia sp.]
MENSTSFSATADAPPADPDTDRKAGACLFGETETQRTERHVLMLRRFSDLAMKAAERIDRQADAAEARAEAAEIEAQEAAAETPATESAEAEAPKPAPVDRGPTAAEISLAIHRLSRVVRYDIALEEKLIRNLLAPPAAPVPAPAPKPDPQPETTRKSKWCKPAPSVILAEAKAKVESFNATALSYDERLEPEDIEDLMAELRDELESGQHDKTLLKHIEGPEKIGADFLLERGIILDLAKIMFGPDRRMERRAGAGIIQATAGRDAGAGRRRAARAGLRARGDPAAEQRRSAALTIDAD